MNTAPAPASRSYLLVPGDRPKRFGKASASAADEVICDRGAAVTPAHKVRATQLRAG